MVGIYVRVSTEEQALNGFSIRAQIQKLSTYCLLKEWKEYAVYKDEGKSGKNINERQGLQDLINDIKIKKIDNVLVYKIDRLTRSTKDLIDLVDFFNKNNCSFNSFTECIDTKSSTGRMFIKITGIFAEFERENIAERVRLGLERKVKEGYSIASKNISFGYDRGSSKGVFVVNQYEAYVVKKIFNLFLTGHSFTNISNYLGKYNICTKNGKKWNSKNIKMVLTNPNYIGKVRYGINTANYFENDGKHKPIIDTNTFDKAQEKLKSNNQSVICSCGKKMSIKVTKYYSCKKRKAIKYRRIICTKCNKSFCYKTFKAKMSI